MRRKNLEFHTVFMALAFMFIVNFMFAAIQGYDFMDAISVQSNNGYNISDECRDALYKLDTSNIEAEFVSRNAFGASPEFPLPMAAFELKYCGTEMEKYGAGTAVDLKKMVMPENFTGVKTEQGFLGSLGSLFATVLSFFGAVVNSIIVFFTVAMQILIVPKGPFNAFISIINAVCTVVVVVWVYQALSPAGDN